MARWRITPTWKKSVIEVQEWTKPGQAGYISHEIGWRWGEFFIETEDDNPPNIEEGVDMFDCGYDCDDWSTDDGCWEETDVDIPDDDEREKMEQFVSENSIYDLDEEGWTMEESHMFINCELNIEKVE